MARAGLPAPASPLNVPIGPHRRYTWVDADLARFKAIKTALGGTVNDVVLTVGRARAGRAPARPRRGDRRAGAQGDGPGVGARRGRARRAGQPRRRRCRRRCRSASPTRATRFAAVHDGDGATSRSPARPSAPRCSPQLADFAPPTIMSQAARLQARQRFFNLVVTNVPGPQLDALPARPPAARPLPASCRWPEPGAGHRDHVLQRPAGLRAAGDYDALPDSRARRPPRGAIDELAAAAGGRAAAAGRRTAAPARPDPAPSRAPVAAAGARASSLARHATPGGGRAQCEPARSAPATCRALDPAGQAAAVARPAAGRPTALSRQAVRGGSGLRRGARASHAAAPAVRSRRAARTLPAVTIALPSSTRRRRPRGNEADRADRRARGRRAARAVPRAGAHRLPARGPAAQGALPGRRARGARAARRATPRASSRWSASPSAPTTSTTPLAVLRRRRACRRIYRKMRLPNYGVFDEERYFQAGDERGDHRGRRRPVGLTICEDIWVPGAPASDEALAGAELIVNVSASPYHAGKAAERERDARPARARQPRRRRVLRARRRPGRAGLRRPLASVDRPRRAPSLARAPQFAEAPADRRRRPPGRARRAAARHAPAPGRRARPRPTSPPRRASTARRPRGEPLAPGGEVAELLDADAEVYAALVLGTRDYVAQERLRARRARAVGRDRLDAGGRSSPSTRSGADQRHRGDHAVALLVDGHAGRRARAGGEPRRRVPRAADRAGRWTAYDELLARRLRGPRARHHRGEPPGPHPRQPADGAVEQVRLARPDDRQQVRDVGRLLDALRRQRRRLRGDQGRARRRSSTGSSTSATRATRASRPRVDRRPRRRAPSCGPTRRTRTRCPTTTCSTRSSRLRRGGPRPRAARRPRPARARPSTASSRLVDLAEYKRRQAPPGHQDHPARRSAATGGADHERATAAELPQSATGPVRLVVLGSCVASPSAEGNSIDGSDCPAAQCKPHSPGRITWKTSRGTR